jgi:hypothetical protein
MHRFFSLRRIVVVVALLCTAALAAPLPAASAADFEVTGTYVLTDRHGNVISDSLSGSSDPGGSFSGTESHKSTGDRVTGTATFDYGAGDTLTFTYEATLDKATGIFAGTWIALSGTGTLADAAGFGSILIEAGSAGSFSLSGTLDP